MIDVINIKCPNCNHDFAVDIYVGEESCHHNVSLTRRTTQHISWEEINREIEYGHGNVVLSVGDTISFQLKNGKQASVSVVAIDPYSKNTVAFAFDDLLWKEDISVEATNRGGWAHSRMVNTLENEILPLFPDELAAVIKPRTIVQNLKGIRYERTSKLWIPSRTEVFGEHENCKECDFGDIHFPLFKTEKSRVKILEDGTTGWYWLRSPHVSHPTYFWYVSDAGVGGIGDICEFGAQGVCPCFIIGKSDKERE